MKQKNVQGSIKMSISREDAGKITAEYLTRKSLEGYAVIEVLDLSEIKYRLPAIYGLQITDRHWIAYLNRANSGYALTSSTILVVSKDTGNVMYFGSAGDEG